MAIALPVSALVPALLALDALWGFRVAVRACSASEFAVPVRAPGPRGAIDTGVDVLQILTPRTGAEASVIGLP